MTLTTDPPTPGRRGPDPLTKVAIICIVVAGLLWLFAKLAHAEPATAPTPVPVAIDWQIWIALGIAALAGVRAIVDTLLAFFKVMAPRTKNTVDDSIRDSLAVAHVKLDNLAGTVSAIVDAAKPPGSGTTSILAVLLLGALAGPALTGCTPAQRSTAATTAGHALVNCTGQAIGATPGLDLATLVAVANTVAAVRLKCMTPSGIDWQCVERDAISKGVTLGGCALVELVAAAASAIRPSGSGLVAADPAPPPGRAELERFRRDVAGGATFHTATGEW